MSLGPTTTTLHYLNACGGLLWMSGRTSGHKIKRRTLIAISFIVSHLYGYWVVPLVASKFSQSGCHLSHCSHLSFFWQVSANKVHLTWVTKLLGGSGLKGRAHFLQPKDSVVAGPEFLSILWSVSCFVLVFSHSDGVKSVKGRGVEWASDSLPVTKPNLNLAGSQGFIHHRVFNKSLFISHHEAGFKCHCIFLWMSGKTSIPK